MKSVGFEMEVKTFVKVLGNRRREKEPSMTERTYKGNVHCYGGKGNFGILKIMVVQLANHGVLVFTQFNLLGLLYLVYE